MVSRRRGVRVHPIEPKQFGSSINTSSNDQQDTAFLKQQSQEKLTRTRRLSTTVVVESNNHDHKRSVGQAKITASEVYNNTSQNDDKSSSKNCSTLEPESREDVEKDNRLKIMFDDGFAWWDSILENKMNFLSSLQNYNTTGSGDRENEETKDGSQDSSNSRNQDSKKDNDVTPSQQQQQKGDIGNARSASRFRERRRSSSPTPRQPREMTTRIKSPNPILAKSKNSTTIVERINMKNHLSPVNHPNTPGRGKKKNQLSFGTTTVKFFNPENLPCEIVDSETFSISNKNKKKNSDNTLIGRPLDSVANTPAGNIQRDPASTKRGISPLRAKRTPAERNINENQIIIGHRPENSQPRDPVSSRDLCGNDTLERDGLPTNITTANADGKKKKVTRRSIPPFFFKGDLAPSEDSMSSNARNTKKSQLPLVKQQRGKTVSRSSRSSHASVATNGRKPIDATAAALRSPPIVKNRKAIEVHSSPRNTSLAPEYKLIPLPHLARIDASQRRSHFKITNTASLYKLETEKLILMAKECQRGGLISSSAVLGENIKKVDLIRFMRTNVFEFETQQQ